MNIFSYYLEVIIDRIPRAVLIAAFLYIAISLIWGFWKNKREALIFLLFGYIAMVLYITVISRESKDHFTYSLTPFSSYYAIANGDKLLFPQIIMNIMMFVPLGLLIKSANRTWKWIYILLCGLLLSITVETLQFFLLKGAAELDDIIHNTFGCFLGIILYVILRFVFVRKKELL